MNFPPIFALAFFGLLDTIAFVFDIFAITAPIGILITTFSTFIYICWLFQRYGFKKTRERLFSLNKVRKSKWLKSGIKIFGASVIPYLNVWAVWDDHKEDLKEEKNKKMIRVNLGNEATGQVEDINQEQETDNLETITEDNTDIEEESEVNTPEVKKDRLQELEETRQDRNMEGIKRQKQEMVNTEGSKTDDYSIFNKSKKFNLNPQKIRSQNKTIDEIVGGLKSGQSFEDYDIDYTGKKMLDTNEPEYYRNSLEQQNTEAKKTTDKLTQQGNVRIQEQKDTDIVNLQRILKFNENRFGVDALAVKRIRERLQKIDKNKKEAKDELTI